MPDNQNPGWVDPNTSPQAAELWKKYQRGFTERAKGDPTLAALYAEQYKLQHDRPWNLSDTVKPRGQNEDYDAYRKRLAAARNDPSRNAWQTSGKYTQGADGKWTSNAFADVNRRIAEYEAKTNQPAAAGALGASAQPQQPPSVATGQINTLPQGPIYSQQSGANPRFMSGAMGGEQDAGPYSRNLPPVGVAPVGGPVIQKPPANPRFMGGATGGEQDAGPYSRNLPPGGGVLQKPVADPGPYSRNLPQSVATGQINNLPQGPIYSQAAQLQAQGGLNAKIMPKIRQQNTNPYSTDPFDPNNPDAYQNQRWTGLERGQEYDPNDVYKYMPQYQPGLNYKDAWLEQQVGGGALSGVASQENDAVQRLLAGLDSAQKTKNDLSMGVASQEGDAAQQAQNQLGEANPVSVSAKDPGVAAAMKIFKQSVAPQIDSQYSLMGLGRSQNKADALNRSMVEALAPQLSEQRQYNEAGAQRKQNQSQFLSDLLMNVGGRRREGLVQGEQLAQGAYGNLAESLLGIGSQRRQGKEAELGFGERAGNTQRDFEKNMADAAERERLRLQNLYLGSVSPPGLPTGASSSKDK